MPCERCEREFTQEVRQRFICNVLASLAMDISQVDHLRAELAAWPVVFQNQGRLLKEVCDERNALRAELDALRCGASPSLGGERA